MKLYYPKSHYDKNARGSVFPLLKPFIKGVGFTDEQRVAMYGVSKVDFDFVEDLEEAELAILTMSWNYYTYSDQMEKAMDFIELCASRNMNVLSWNAGDHGVKVPKLNNLIVLRESGYRSKFSSNEYTLPSFINDPLQKYYNTATPCLIPYSLKPRVGFCGQAHYSKKAAALQLGQVFLRNLKYQLGQSWEEPEAFVSTIYLRAAVLKNLQESPGVETNFILRQKYRAGVSDDKSKHQTTLEFYDNLKESPYILCIRGAGNFSVRFYEALAMGRIPVLVNTDCSLPLQGDIDWKKHLVWVEYKDRYKVGDILKNFHVNLSEYDFLELQIRNRKLWEEKLGYGGFFRNFVSNM